MRECLASAHLLVRRIRNALLMTQSQLARRAGLPQSHLAKIEAGRVDIQMGTLQRILRAMFCEAVVVPRFRKRPRAALLERSREMSPRGPGEERLRGRPSSGVWDEAPTRERGPCVRIVGKEDDRDALGFWLAQPPEARVAAVEFLRRQTYRMKGKTAFPRLARSIRLRGLRG